MNDTAERPAPDPKIDLLRHTLATVAYRGGKAVRDAAEGFGTFRVAESTRTPVEILAHIGDLLDWGARMARGEYAWHDATPLPWEQEVERFFACLARFDEALAAADERCFVPERIFRGPIADSLNHIGQIAMLRRLHGAPIRGENYFRAKVETGRVGRDQPEPVVEFD